MFGVDNSSCVFVQLIDYRVNFPSGFLLNFICSLISSSLPPVAGGAFPECHVAQYPLDMGRPDKRGGAGGSGVGGRSSQTLALTLNAEGDINYDALVRQGENRNKIVASGHKAIVPKLDQLNADMPKPDEEEVEATAKATAAALALRLDRKQAAVNPATVPSAPGAAQYIKYTPASANSAQTSTRIIKMQDMPVDPLEPPKFRHVKVPRGPGSPPVPVMHSPPRGLTHKDQQDWKIPPCVSNWKNAKGYTIPLDKRLAADGRGLQEVQINDQFAKFTEALYIAEHKARSAVETRAKMQREIMARDKERKEEELRDLAMRARLDRLGGAAGIGTGADIAPAPSGRDEGRAYVAPSFRRSASPESDEERDLPPSNRTRDERRGGGGGGGGNSRGGDRDRRGNRSDDDSDKEERERHEETREEREERRRRDEIREDRKRERERERRLDSKDAHGFKRSKLTRDKDRDISEKIALGMAKVTGGEAMYDQRLFNQDTGLHTGLVEEDAYNLYDQPLFADRSDLFKGRANRDEEAYEGRAGGGPGGAGAGGEIDTARFKPDKGFTGADYGGKSGGGGEDGGNGGGKGDLQFEKDPAEADPFGLDAFLSDVREGRKKPLDKIGKGGGMAAAGGSAGKREDYEGGGSGRRMDFTSGGK
jgi:SNW domain-containing protein 1